MNERGSGQQKPKKTPRKTTMRKTIRRGDTSRATPASQRRRRESASTGQGAGGGRGGRGGRGGAGGAGGAERPVTPQRERYLVAPLPATLTPAGLGMLNAAAPGGPQALAAVHAAAQAAAEHFVEQLKADDSVTVHRVLPSASRQLGAFAAGVSAAGVSPTEFPDVAVVEMDADRAAMFADTPMVHVEPDLPLHFSDGTPTAALDYADPGLVPLGDEVPLTFVVRGGDGQPLAEAEIYLMSSTFPARGTTDANGQAVIAVSATVLTEIKALYVKPAGDHWSVWLPRPHLSPSEPNQITCQSFAATFPGFPGRELNGWGRRAMRFDALPPNYRGHGVRVAVVDSGAAVTHPDLEDRIAGGRDIPGQNDDGWRVDTVGHGSHCAGIIGGNDNGSGIVGMVPEAEVFACKIFPGGRFSDLIEALDYCIANQVDVVNLSLGSPEPSELVRFKIEQARQAGVACVVAAGNSADAVSFPASMPSVLAVAAIGKTGEYPANSYHATQILGGPTAEGYYSAKFTCFGPEIDVCGPGVAVVSSVPPQSYAAMDGTSFAGPHVTALAALILAHHPDFRERFAQRGAARVDRLFEIIRASCRPVNVGDPARTGAGIPDAAVALGVSVPGAGVWSAPPVTVETPVPGVGQSVPVAGQPLPGQPLPGQPLPGQPNPLQPVAGQSFPGQPVAGQPTAAMPGAALPPPGQPGAAQPGAAGQPGAGVPSGQPVPGYPYPPYLITGYPATSYPGMGGYPPGAGYPMSYPYSDVPAGLVPVATEGPPPGPAAAGVMGTMPAAAPAPPRGNGAAGGPTAFTPTSAEPGLPPGAGGAPGDPLAALRAAMRAAGLLEASAPAAGE